ncbi:GAF domain-containing protein [Mesorhizobium sp. LjNodule214]
MRLFEEVQARTRDLGEALQQQTATADVLKVISASAFDLQTVLDTLVESAVRLCRADKGCLERVIDGRFEYAAITGFPPGFGEYGEAHQTEPGRGSAVGRAAEERRVMQIEDVTVDPEYTHSAIAAVGGMRTVLAVPLLREGELLGTFAMIRTEVQPFSEREIELVKTFADQAVIAIENVRLFDEVQARTSELGEALQQQTATADVLKVISASAFDLDTVLTALTTSAASLCNAGTSGIFMLKDGAYHISAAIGILPEHLAYERANPQTPRRGSWVGRAAIEKAVVHVPDVSTDAEAEYLEIAKIGGFSAVLCVPLLREGAVIGVFGLTRSEPGPFSERQIELVQTFADQAVIAIENVRLFDEVQARTREVTEALEQQTATGAILQVIAGSPTDIQPVLDAVAESAARLCDAYDATIYLLRSDRLAVGAHHGPIPIDDAGLPLARDVVTGRAVLDRVPVHVHDLTVAGEEFATGRMMAHRLGFRAILATPLLQEEKAIGALMIRRNEARAFSANQIDLLKTFADQAVIAIQNVRLFDEVQARTADVSEALRQQTATADVLKVISRAAFDLPTVLNALVESAAKLCGASYGGIFLRYGDMLRGRATISERKTDWTMDHPIKVDRRWLSGRVALSGSIEYIPDVEEDPDFNLQEFRAITDTRALMGVPMLREGKVEGVFFLGKMEPNSFTSRQGELVQTFADQAVIAIENVRLFDQVQARTQELAASLQDLQAAQGRLLQTEKLASLGQLTAGIAHEIKNPLNFVSNFSLLSNELVDDIRTVLEGAGIDGGTRAEVEELGDTLKANLDKVVQHAKRADSIVRNMLMHSREGSGEHRVVDINSLVDESLGLAYHGARAEKKDFNVTLEKNYDPRAGSVDLYPQEITRVLLNLIANGFYATAKRGAEGNGAAYEPMLSTSTKNLGDAVEIRIRDNGTGIPPEVKEKMFNPFFTTKPAGEGTGLGLSLSHDIIVKQHSGTIEVETVPGSFTEFRIVLPRSGVATAKLELEPEAEAEERA